MSIKTAADFRIEYALRIELVNITEQADGNVRFFDALTAFSVNAHDAGRLIAGVEHGEAHRTTAGQLLSVADHLGMAVDIG